MKNFMIKLVIVFLTVILLSSCSNVWNEIYGGLPDDYFTHHSTISALSENTWYEGSLSSNTTDIWYSFSVVGGRTYQVWWNDQSHGDGNHTLNVKVSAFYNNSTSAAIFLNKDSGTEEVPANQTGTVLLRVTSFSGNATGTFEIAFSPDPDLRRQDLRRPQSPPRPAWQE